MHLKILSALTLISVQCAIAQIENTTKDSLYIHHFEDDNEPDKVLHAEPLFIDLIRDLGARKGEKEWNIGLGLTDKYRYDSYETLIEYEWAPINRLGLEVELPFTFYAPTQTDIKDSIPGSKMNSLKLATQWSFLVNTKHATSMALGYIHEFELPQFKSYNSFTVLANVFNPFLVIAKRWGNNFHSLIYTGPKITHHFRDNHVNAAYEVNTNFHYMISGTKNFLGVEFNKTFNHIDFDMTIRPQLRLGIADNLLIGIVTGIPIQRENERLSGFLRLIREPKHKH